MIGCVYTCAGFSKINVTLCVIGFCYIRVDLFTTLNNYYRKITYLQLKKCASSFFIFRKYWSFVLETKFTTEIVLVPGQASFQKLLARKGKLTTLTTRTAYFRTPALSLLRIIASDLIFLWKRSENEVYADANTLICKILLTYFSVGPRW